MDISKKIIIGSISILCLELAFIYLMKYPYAPYSLSIVIPSFLLAGVIGEPHGMYIGGALGGLIPAAMFYAYSKHIIKIDTPFTKLSIITFGVIFVFSIANAVEGWEITIKYTSLLRAQALVLMAFVPPICIAMYALFKRQSFTVNQSLFCHWLLFIWVGCSAFPWFGELI